VAGHSARGRRLLQHLSDPLKHHSSRLLRVPLNESIAHPQELRPARMSPSGPLGARSVSGKVGMLSEQTTDKTYALPRLAQPYLASPASHLHGKTSTSTCTRMSRARCVCDNRRTCHRVLWGAVHAEDDQTRESPRHTRRKPDPRLHRSAIAAAVGPASGTKIPRARSITLGESPGFGAVSVTSRGGPANIALCALRGAFSGSARGYGVSQKQRISSVPGAPTDTLPTQHDSPGSGLSPRLHDT
jgi:hypothetical protein